MEVIDILDSLQHRTSFGGIGTAYQYVSGVAPCFDGGLCPVKSFGKDGKNWEKELQSSASRLVYSDKRTQDSSFISRSAVDGGDAFVLTYDTVLTSRDRDRDRDIVEPKGMVVDVNMPLLWQHIQLQPIGKMLGVLYRDDEQIVIKNGIVDTDLGRDAAKLVRAGVLRTSVGFVPAAFEPIGFKSTEKGKVPDGWHIKESNALENSLVSIPANPSANIIAIYEKEFDGLCGVYSKGGLRNSLVREWAKSVYDSRTVIFKGHDFAMSQKMKTGKDGGVSTEDGDTMGDGVDLQGEENAGGGNGEDNGGKPPKGTGNENGKGEGVAAAGGKRKNPKMRTHEVNSASGKDQGKSPSVECCGELSGSDGGSGLTVGEPEGGRGVNGSLYTDKGVAPYRIKSSYLDGKVIYGSFEWVREKLTKSLREANGNDWQVLSLFPDSAIVTQGQDLWRAAWDMADEGPEWASDFEEVEGPEDIDFKDLAIDSCDRICRELTRKAVYGDQSAVQAMINMGGLAENFQKSIEEDRLRDMLGL